MDPLQLLTSASNLLSATGVIIIQVPNDFSFLQKNLLNAGLIDREFWIACPDHISYFSKDSLIKLCRSVGLEKTKILGDYPIDFDLFNDDTNYVQDKTKGTNCHFARVNIENMLHSISPERTNLIYEQLGEMGLGREIIGFFKKVRTKL